MSTVSSHIRWCLTGTPIQNSLDDLGSLVRFLGMPIFSEPAIFRKYVNKVRIRKGSDKGEFENLRLLLSAICLRRNKTVMPSKGHETEDRHPKFSEQERRQYRNLELACKRAIVIGSKGKSEDAAHHKVMEALLRLRMFCNNGLVLHNQSGSSSSRSLSHPDEILSFLQQSGEAICSYCSIDVLSLGPLAEADSGYLTRCWRVICGECVQQYRAEKKDGEAFTCPLCCAQHEMEGMHDDEMSPGPPSEKTFPSKITCLVQDVQRHYLTDKW